MLHTAAGNAFATAHYIASPQALTWPFRCLCIVSFVSLYLVPLIYDLAPLVTAERTPVVNARLANCNSFITNGTSAAQYDYYRFYDFRSIASTAWSVVEISEDPDNVTAGASTSDMRWQLDWARREDLRYPSPQMESTLLPMDYQSDRVFITASPDNETNSILSLTSARVKESSQASAGMDFTDQSIIHVSLRLRGRVTGAPGACAAFFTFANDTQEADIELLTRDTGDIVGFNTQPTLNIHGQIIPNSHFNMSLPYNLTRDQWITYRLDWTAGQMVWYVDGVQMANTTKNVPVASSRLSITLWGNGGTWTDNMAIGDSANLQLQWIEMAYNLSGTRPTIVEEDLKTYKVCNLDITSENDSGNSGSSESNSSSGQPLIFPPAHGSGAWHGYRVARGLLIVALCSALVFTS